MTALVQHVRAQGGARAVTLRLSAGRSRALLVTRLRTDDADGLQQKNLNINAWHAQQRTGHAVPSGAV